MSNPRTRINLALLALVLVLGALALWGPAPEDPAAPREYPPLTPMEADQVRHVTIERPGLEGAIRLRRGDDDRWTVTLPGRESPLPADTFKAERLAELAEARVYDRFPATDPGAYGLDAPRATVTLNAATLRFGTTEPLRHRRYVLADGQVNLIDDHYFDAISNTPANWVDKALLPGAPALAAVRLPDLTVRRDETGWTMEPAPPEAPSADALQAFVDAWRHARALTVKLPDEPPAGEEEVVLVLADGGERRFRLVQRRPRLQLWDPERRVLYEFAAYTSERLLDPARHEPQDEEEGTTESDAPDGAR